MPPSDIGRQPRRLRRRTTAAWLAALTSLATLGAALPAGAAPLQAGAAAVQAGAAAVQPGAAAVRPGAAAVRPGAAVRRVEAFDNRAWQALQDEARRPAVVVFSTTDCGYCPAVLDQLAREIRQRQLAATLVAVVMDVAPGDDDAALQADPHYRLADRLFAFAGQAPQLRHAVDPRWRGVTPYVVFQRPGQPAVAVAGPPSAAVLDAWAAAPARR